VGQDFTARAGLDDRIASLLPSWYFLEDDGGNKARALYLDQVYQQAQDLKQRYSDTLVAQAQTRFPQLHEYVMEGYTPNGSFVMVLSKKYQKNMPTLNLVELMNQLATHFRFHLMWAQDPQRYQIIVDGLRAEKVLEVLDFDKSNRYLTNFQNRRIRAFQGLESLERLQEVRQLAKTTIALASSSPNLDPDSKVAKKAGNGGHSVKKPTESPGSVKGH
jgi:hypothetical protein